MKTHTLLRWNVLFLVSVLAFSLAVHASRTLAATKTTTAPAKVVSSKIKGITLESIPTKQVKRKASLERQHPVDLKIRTCGEAGICKPTEKRVILSSDSSGKILSSYLQGCRSMKWLEGEVVLKCPSDALVPEARTERVFKMQDIFSNGQINATAVQQQMLFKGAGVKVAVLDTGIDNRHPEMSGRIVATASFVVDSSVTDVVGHGTHVAGIIAGQGVSTLTDNNGTNRALGVSPEATIIVGKICNDEGYCAEGDISAGIEWAVAQGAKVINLSLGGGAFQNECDSDPLAQKVNWAVDQGAVVVAASGNGAEANPGVATPACASKALAVGAVDQTGVRPVWSGYGTALDLVAPGLSILSSIPCSVAGSCPEAGYGWWSGTSMATPAVSGVVALVRGANPALTAQEVTTILKQTAWDLGNPGNDPLYGYGRVNAYPAVRAALDRDGDGSLIPDDCNDHDAAVRPGAAELCDGIDNNCNGTTDEGCTPASSSSSSVTPSSSSSSSFTTSSRSSSSSSRQSSSSYEPSCGNGELDPGEQCEFADQCPPEQDCNWDCQCESRPSSSSSSRSSVSSAQPVCGNGLMEAGEQCENGYACYVPGQQCNNYCRCFGSSSSSSISPYCTNTKNTHQNRMNEYNNKLNSSSDKCDYNKQDELWYLFQNILWLSNLHNQYCGYPLTIPDRPPACSSSSSSNWCNEHKNEFKNLRSDYLQLTGEENSDAFRSRKYCQLPDEKRRNADALWRQMNDLIRRQPQNCGFSLPSESPTSCSSSSFSQGTICGNGRQESGEECDDGNPVSGDGCTAACRIERGWNCDMNRIPICRTACGDGIRATSEPCDDGNNGNGDGCSASCTKENGWICFGDTPSRCDAVCGDGFLTMSEMCDDWNMRNGDGCSASCTKEDGWICSGIPSVCTSVCGDGRLTENHEQCDDRNMLGGDGCSTSCTKEDGWTCSGIPSICRTSCGDGVRAGQEECDDGNSWSGDGCSSTCRTEAGWICDRSRTSVCKTVCGDGVMEPGEQCDDGNLVSGDGCSAICTIETRSSSSSLSSSYSAPVCGNTFVENLESCDDGNKVGGDGCSSACRVESGWRCSGFPNTCIRIGPNQSKD
ncbi:MAG: S8 family serine peptidase [Candidatus Peribacteraceae bacterium]|nr:S8 family serine peptidase [Candidatus Peribacteraceae bacterium]MDD5074549.1 S8 family serine peptidase [Candidatus Peribacteraceae bacterium]